MLFTPSAARLWLGPDSRNRPWSGHGAMMIRRREALGVLLAAYGAWGRFALGSLAWALGIAGAVLVGRGIADGGAVQGAGIGLLVVGTFLGGAVVATGSALARAVAGWLTLATAVTADGGRADATPGPETMRVHEAAVAADRTTGRGELWRLPLLPRTVSVLVLTAAGVVLAVQAVLGYDEASTPYAADDLRGAWLARVLAAVVCLLAAALTASGLRRVHRARMHRVAHDEPASTAATTGSLTPAVGSGAIVVGGRPPAGAAAPPSWASAPSATSSDAAPAMPAAEPPPSASVPSAASSDAAPATPAAEPQPAPGGPRVRLSDGRELAPGTTLVGRAPQPRPDEHADALLAVTDERVSKTHLTVRVEPGRVVVVDRGSTNGTAVHEPDGGSRPLPPGEPYEVTDGQVVVLGATTLIVGEPADDVERTVLRTE